MRSPLKARPLKNPGESLEARRNDRFIDDVLPYVAASVAFASIAVSEWIRDATGAGPSPRLYTAFAVALIVFTAWRIWKIRPELRQMALGADGEKVVGQFLERLRESGAQVFHDIPATGFNLDHVVIHGSGIYVIETKTLSKPDRGKPELLFDGEQITKNGLEPDRNPVAQVRGAQRWLDELLKESTGRAFPVRPVVLYPGWFIQPTAEARNSDVWVLNPKALPAFIENSREQLRKEDVALCAFHISRFIRGSDV